MTAPPLTTREATLVLAQLAEQVESLRRRGINMPIPPALIAAAERIVTLVNAVDDLPVGELIMQLVQPDEIVDTAVLRDRLASIGRPTKPSAASVALHRAVQRGELERVATGRYRRRARPAADGPQRQTGMEVNGHVSDLEMAKAPQEAPV